MTDRLLLDTCALLWLASGSSSLSRKARELIDGAATVFVSPISLWEIARKVKKGTLLLPMEPQAWFSLARQHHRLSLLQMSDDVMFTAAGLPEIHKDPADRFIIASAILNDLVVVTSDGNFPKYGVDCVV